MTTCLVLLGYGAILYQSDYQFAQADRGRKTISDYTRLITESASHNEQAALKLSEYLQSRNQLPESRAVLESTSFGQNNWQGWERQGILWERTAFKDTGTTAQARLAAQFYDRVLRVYPSYERGMERRALLALKLGQWDLARKLAGYIREANPVNNNELYIRSKVEEATGNTTRALELYMQLSSAGPATTNSLFTQREIREHLLSLHQGAP